MYVDRFYSRSCYRSKYKKFNSDRIYACSGDESYTTESYGISDLVGQLLIIPAPQIEIEEIN